MGLAEDLHKMFEKDALAKMLGIEIIDIKPGYAKTTLQVNPDLVNSLAMTHGATVFALMDMALAAASNSQGKVAVALSVNINFMQATYVGDRLYAIATEEKLTNRTGFTGLYGNGKRGKVAVATVRFTGPGSAQTLRKNRGKRFKPNCQPESKKASKLALLFRRRLI